MFPRARRRLAPLALAVASSFLSGACSGSCNPLERLGLGGKPAPSVKVGKLPEGPLEAAEALGDGQRRVWHVQRGQGVTSRATVTLYPAGVQPE